MMYRVVKYFEDLTDNRYAYHVGDIFPHDGLHVSDERFKQLSTTKNRRKIVLIEEIKDESTDNSDNLAVDVKPKRRGRPKKA